MFLDRNFSFEHSESLLTAGGSSCPYDANNADMIHSSLAPFESLLQGISSRFDIEKRYQPSVACSTVAAAIYSILRLSAEAKTYAMASNDEDFWHVVTDVFRDRVMLSTTLSSLTSNSKDLLHAMELTKAVESFEQGLCEKDAMSCQSLKLYLSLMSAFGECLHMNIISVALKRLPDERRAISESLKICIATLTAGRRPIFFSKYISAYVKATLENVIVFLGKNQFLLPRSLADLPSALKISGAENEIMKLSLKIEDRIINALTTFQLKNITRVELDLLYMSPSIIESFSYVAQNWDVDSSELQVLLIFLLISLNIDGNSN